MQTRQIAHSKFRQKGDATDSNRVINAHDWWLVSHRSYESMIGGTTQQTKQSTHPDNNVTISVLSHA